MTLWIDFTPEFQVIAVAAGSPLTLTAFLGAYIVRKKLGLLQSGALACDGHSFRWSEPWKCICSRARAH